MKRCFALILALRCLVGCIPFPTEVYDPVFDSPAEMDVIPAEGKVLHIPFRYDYHTKTVWPMEARQFKCLLTIGEDSQELGPNEASWYWDYREAHSNLDAVLIILIPENDSGQTREVVVKVSIDDLYNNDFEEEEGHTHQWGEWRIVYSGVQEHK